MNIKPTDASSSQLAYTQNENVDASVSGRTTSGKSVTTAETPRKMLENDGDSHQSSISLADRKVEVDTGIATAGDFEFVLAQRQHFNDIRQLIHATPAFGGGVDNSSGRHSLGLASGTIALVAAAFGSIQYAGGEKPAAYDNYLHSRDMMPAKGETPPGAKQHLQKAFDNIKEMQELNTGLETLSPVDIALSLADPKNREILQPHIEAIFNEKENKPK